MLVYRVANQLANTSLIVYDFRARICSHVTLSILFLQLGKLVKKFILIKGWFFIFIYIVITNFVTFQVLCGFDLGIKS